MGIPQRRYWLRKNQGVMRTTPDSDCRSGSGFRFLRGSQKAVALSKNFGGARLQPLIRLRTREGMAIARTKGKLRGKQPKLSDKQQKELCRMHETGQYSISDLADLFSVSRPTVYRTLVRKKE